MKTVADMKRKIKVGTIMELTECDKHSKYMNVPRKVVKVDTTGFYLESGNNKSHLSWPKRSEIKRITETEFSILFSDMHFIMSYRIIE